MQVWRPLILGAGVGVVIDIVGVWLLLEIMDGRTELSW